MVRIVGSAAARVKHRLSPRENDAWHHEVSLEKFTAKCRSAPIGRAEVARRVVAGSFQALPPAAEGLRPIVVPIDIPKPALLIELVGRGVA
jgi:hypothetical protein